ncbi:family 16 glycoside hydrolase [Pontiella sulfatireligans]|uniref:Acetyl esterase n=1 Tax=Pontiella sulfatireligans TaxID=2750658 RepID=A0A6C2UHH4_9BACT|nr:family 16 glycoside hydrolase [Pontiella sulfatireligans]VGO18861.1 hypothetical protein SCARR_00914 [Pontiella sulfatireligans]
MNEKMKIQIFGLWGILVLGGAITSLAVVSSSENPPDGFEALFNGGDFRGWYGFNPHSVTNLAGEAREAALAKMRADFANHWRIENGELINDGSGPFACTDKSYGDIELMLEFKVKYGGDSGIYLRGTPEVQLLDRFAAYNPANPDFRPFFGSGGLIHNPPKTLGRDALIAFDSVSHNWQPLRIVQVGARTWVYLNGKGVVEGTVMENYWDRSKLLPATGPILLQSNGREVRFRNIFVRELSSGEGKNFLADNPPLPEPDFCDEQYGPEARQVLHFWKAKSSGPTPLVVYSHDGGWWGGGRFQRRDLGQLQAFLDAGISYAAVAYRFTFETEPGGENPPIKGCMEDAARAVQYLRSKAEAFNIDTERIGLTGGSAGGCTSLWLATRPDMADPSSGDPVLRESTRVFCAGVNVPQTTIDPVQAKKWIPNIAAQTAALGVKADRKKGLSAEEVLMQNLENYRLFIEEFSPYAQISKDDPPLYLFYQKAPEMGVVQKDTAHSSNYGLPFHERCRALGVESYLSYPGCEPIEYDSAVDFLIKKLTGAE